MAAAKALQMVKLEEDLEQVEEVCNSKQAQLLNIFFSHKSPQFPKREI